MYSVFRLERLFSKVCWFVWEFFDAGFAAEALQIIFNYNMETERS